MMDLRKLDQERLFEAIRDGIADGIFRIATNASDMPSTDFYASIQEGVKNAIKELEAVPCSPVRQREEER